MLVLYFCCAVALISGSGQADHQPSYVVVVPSLMRPGRTLDISVSILTSTEPVTVYAKVYYNQTSMLEPYKEKQPLGPPTTAPSGPAQIVVVEATQSIVQQGIISLTIPTHATQSQYSVMVSGTGNRIEFANQTLIQTETKSISVFIQTDKGMFKPGDLVRMRVVAVDSSLMTYKGKFNITIQDPNKSVIKKWTNVTTTSGVFSGELQLSEQPVLGSWVITAKTHMNDGKEKSTTFTVKEYVLPKFEVKLTLPTFILPETESLPVSLSAKYTYGKNVNGKAMLSIQVKTSYEWEKTTYNYKMINRTIQLINGIAETIVTRKELMYIAGSKKCTSPMCYATDTCVSHYALVSDKLMYKSLFVHAVVTEELTGNIISANGSITMQPFPIQIKFLEFSPSTFKPGLTWTGMIQMNRIDNTALLSTDYMDGSGNTNKVNVEFTCYNTSTPYKSFEFEKNFTIGEGGLVEIKFIPNNITKSCNLEARYKYAQTSKSVEKFLSSEGHSIQVVAPGLTGSVQVGNNVEFVVTTTQTVTEFYYQILSKGLIVKTQSVVASSGDITSFIVNFDQMLCRKTSPSGRIFVWYLTDNGEFIVDTMNFNVDGAFENDVTLEFSTDEVRPGDSVSLTVNAAAGSYVLLLAVDQSVQLMGAGNDITQDQVMSELRQYDSSRYYVPDYYYRYWWPMPSGGKDTSELIKNAGVAVLTDANIYTSSPYYYPTYYANAGKPVYDFAALGPESAGAPGAPRAIDDEKSKIDGGNSLQEPEDVRIDFPETWIWTEETVGVDGRMTLETHIPDTITSWVASAFAVSDTAGMGVTKNIAKVTAFKPFFVSLNLPYSVIRSEEVALQVTVFNYLQYDTQVVVTLTGSDDLLIRHPNAVTPTIGQDVERVVYVPAGDGVKVSFWIVPIRIGQTPISVIARSTTAADQVQQPLLVKPEGEAHEFTRSILVNHGQILSYTEEMTVEFPPVTVPDSQIAVFTVIGDKMGPSINGLDKLLAMPSGCGEQNMVKFAPNIYILQYLQATDQLTETMKNKALNYLETGYQRELTYQRKDNSFSAFGNSDHAGSTWLTAFVIRCFNQAKPYIVIDQIIIDAAAMWIVENQDRSGAFMEPGRVIHRALQGGSSKGVGLTAYVAATLLENKDTISDTRTQMAVSTAIDNALNHLEALLPNITSDAYSLSLVAYVLTLANRETSTIAVSALDALATTNGNNKYWEQEKPVPIESVPYWYRHYPAPSNSIEMTAYALLIYTKKALVTEGMSVASWLAAQRSSLGGYRSTQDTVIGLMALSTFESTLGVKDMQQMDVTLWVDGQKHQFETITKDNSIVLQSYEVSSAISRVDLLAVGAGIAMFQMSIQYHQTETDDLSGIDLIVTAETNELGQVITQACGTWKLDEGSGMVVLQINQLTAYQALTDTIISSHSDYGVRRFEIDDRTLTIYLDELPHNEEVCITVTSVNTSPVSNLQPAVVLIFPYYNPESQKSAFYLPDKLNNVSMCATCLECCEGITTTTPLPYYDNCYSQPCVNNGRCVDDLRTYMCECQEGFTGRNCQTATNSINGRVSQIKDGTGTATIESVSVLLATLLMVIRTILM